MPRYAFKILNTLLLALALALVGRGSPATGAEPLGCASELAPKTFVEDALDSVRRSSEALKTALSNRIARGEIVEYDVVVVGGGGVHGGILQRTLREIDPRIRVLGIDAGGGGSKIFDSEFFRLNTFETCETSHTCLLGSPVQVKDFMPADERGGKTFPVASSLGSAVTLNQYADPGELLLGTTVTKVDLDAVGDARFVVHTADGNRIRARHVVFTTGLGAPSIPVTEAATLDLIKSERAKISRGELPGILLADDLKSYLKSRSAPDFGEEEVAIIGGGDEGKNTAEFFGCMAPPAAYGKSNCRSAAQMHWIGQKSPDRESFLAASKQNRTRYRPTADLIGSGKLKTYPDRLRSIRKIGNRYEITLADADGKTSSKVVDRVVFATGYRPETDLLGKGLRPAYYSRNVLKLPSKGRLRNFVSAFRKETRTTPGLYGAGPVGMRIHGHVSIETTAPLTREIAIEIGEDVVRIRQLSLRSEALPFTAKVQYPVSFHSSELSQTDALLRARVEATRLISPRLWTGEAELEITLGKTSFEVRVSGLAEGEQETFRSDLSTSAEFAEAMAGLGATAKFERFRVRVRRSDLGGSQVGNVLFESVP